MQSITSLGGISHMTLDIIVMNIAIVMLTDGLNHHHQQQQQQHHHRMMIILIVSSSSS